MKSVRTLSKMPYIDKVTLKFCFHSNKQTSDELNTEQRLDELITQYLNFPKDVWIILQEIDHFNN